MKPKFDKNMSFNHSIELSYIMGGAGIYEIDIIRSATTYLPPMNMERSRILYESDKWLAVGFQIKRKSQKK